MKALDVMVAPVMESTVSSVVPLPGGTSFRPDANFLPWNSAR